MCHGSFQCHTMLHTIYNDCIWYNWFWTRKKNSKQREKNLQNIAINQNLLRLPRGRKERNQRWYSIGNKVIEICKYFNWIGPVLWNRLKRTINNGWCLDSVGIKMIQRYIFWFFLFVLRKYCSGNDPKCWVLTESFGS